MARGPITNIKDPLPKRGFVSVSLGVMVKVRGSQSPLPKHAPAFTPWPKTTVHSIPIKPLPGTTGSNATVGYPT